MGRASNEERVFGYTTMAYYSFLFRNYAQLTGPLSFVTSSDKGLDPTALGDTGKIDQGPLRYRRPDGPNITLVSPPI